MSIRSLSDCALQRDHYSPRNGMRTLGRAKRKLRGGASGRRLGRGHEEPRANTAGEIDL
jgi:hypothetical protein